LRIKREVLQLLLSRKESRRAFDFVLVDEGQDLVPESFAILQSISNHITVFADHLQQIYEGGAHESSILEALGQPLNHALLLGPIGIRRMSPGWHPIS
jgi:superfamily I DNA/RNA helicase